MRLLFIGDVVGKGGRKAVAHHVPLLRTEYGCDFCIVNGENMAGGGGLSRRCLDELLRAGVDVITTGDHIWDQKEFVTQIVDCPTVLRPANLPPMQPGRGYALFPTIAGVPVLVISLLGRVFMGYQADCPFRAVDAILAECATQAKIIFVDFHAEATSEKIAMGRHLDGRVSAVIGTHTHVPTADEQLLAGGTAFQCDAGMVGARDSVLGRAIDPVLRRFVTGMPGHFTVIETGIRLQGTLVDIDPATGRATAIQRLVRDWDGPVQPG